MLGYSLCMLCGACIAMLASDLPSGAQLAALGAAGCLLSFQDTATPGGFHTARRHAALGRSIIGSSASGWQRAWKRRTLVATVRIAEFPVRHGDTIRFVAETGRRDGLPDRVRLSWYDTDEEPRVGETWALVRQVTPAERLLQSRWFRLRGLVVFASALAPAVT